MGLFVALGGMLSSTPAWGFGAAGHTIVCEIAYRELTPAARGQVTALLRDGRGGLLAKEGKTLTASRFAESCVWPDLEPRRRGEDHYVNTTRDAARIDSERCGGHATCLFTAIRRDRAILANPKASATSRLVALMYLGHWLGDLHQPLHVSFADDQGGNRVEQRGFLCEGSLHRVWDECLVRRNFGDDPIAAATAIYARVDGSERDAWRRGGYVDWAHESFALATSSTVGYCDRTAAGCWYEPASATYSPTGGIRRVRVDATYVKSHKSVVEARLAQAGVRLGALLNDVLR